MAENILDLICQYECMNCNFVFALIETLGPQERGKRCPKCGGIDIKQIKPKGSSQRTNCCCMGE